MLKDRIGQWLRKPSLVSSTLEPNTVEPLAATGGDVEDFWDKKYTAPVPPPRSSWYIEPQIIRHINKIVCGEPIDGLHAGFHQRLKQFAAHLPSGARALSVGCGMGGKEMDVLKLGIVQHFDCYEVSSASIEGGQQAAQSLGLSDHITFHHADAFKTGVSSQYDMVYWNNALHHMLDVPEAIRWSRDRLNSAGVFAMDDYVGATRFQHSPETLGWANRLLANIPERLLEHWDGTRHVPRVLELINPIDIEKADPSEAVDCGNILFSIRSIFPAAKIINTGGVAYFIALNDTFQNFNSDDDLALLGSLLLLDEALANVVETQYAVAFALKD